MNVKTVRAAMAAANSAEHNELRVAWMDAAKREDEVLARYTRPRNDASRATLRELQKAHEATNAAFAAYCKRLHP